MMDILKKSKYILGTRLGRVTFNQFRNIKPVNESR
jgi:hypothetical protein